MMITEFLVESIETAYENRKDLWEDSPFRQITLLSNDERGKWGEGVVYGIINNLTDLNVEWDGDTNTNQDDGVYDIVITRNHSKKKTRVEVKTASRGNCRTANWQHENIYSSNKWDKLIFFDFDLFGFYLTVIDYSELTFDVRHPVFGRKPTLRNNQDDKYKMDFGNLQQQKGLDSGYTFWYDITNPDEEGLRNHLIKHLHE
jgi:hypothetical protein